LICIGISLGSLELDHQHQADRDRERADYHSQKENRFILASMIKTEKKPERKNSHEKVGVVGAQSAHSSGTSTPIAYSLGHMGAGGNAIAAAASQAIAATQQVKNVDYHSLT
jgi:hypothetical protein